MAEGSSSNAAVWLISVPLARIPRGLSRLSREMPQHSSDTTTSSDSRNGNQLRMNKRQYSE